MALLDSGNRFSDLELKVHLREREVDRILMLILDIEARIKRLDNQTGIAEILIIEAEQRIIIGRQAQLLEESEQLGKELKDTIKRPLLDLWHKRRHLESVVASLENVHALLRANRASGRVLPSPPSA